MSGGRPPIAVPDHLVFAAATLAQGIEYIADLTGVAPRAGGKHATMGTHNAVVRLAERLYLEILAIDPDAPRPTRRRWFDLDDAAVQADLAERPRLIHWVARSQDLAFATSRAKIDPGEIVAFERGDYRWRLTVRTDGSRPGQGLVPTLIEWDVPQHPADALPASGLSLAQLAGSHPDPASIRAALAALDLSEVMSVTFDRTPRIAAMLRTPKGLVTI